MCIITEKNCDGKIACANGDGCYIPSEHCNSVPNCGDNSDEADCGDTSDEQSCVKVQISDLWFLNAVKSLSHALSHTHTLSWVAEW